MNLETLTRRAILRLPTLLVLPYEPKRIYSFGGFEGPKWETHIDSSGRQYLEVEGWLYINGRFVSSVVRVPR